jgi:putative ABC transport system substrate-binding protein
VAAKRLEVLHELLRTSAAVALLVNPNNPVTEPETKVMRDAARSLGLQLHVLDASTEGEIDAAFGTLIELRVGALLVSVDSFLTNQRDQIVALAARHAVPAIYGLREFAAAGGLMSYGTDLADGFRQVGVYAGKILKGAKPADSPHWLCPALRLRRIGPRPRPVRRGADPTTRRKHEFGAAWRAPSFIRAGPHVRHIRLKSGRSSLAGNRRRS